MSNFTWSEHQNEIFTQVGENLTQSYIIDACAGASKTTTLVEMVNRLVAEKEVRPHQILALAFNKKIAEALSAKMPQGVICSTMNAFGHRALRQYLPASRLSVSQWKEKNIWQNFPAYEALDKSEQKHIDKAYSRVKMVGALLLNFDFDLCSDPERAQQFVIGMPMRPLCDHSAEAIFVDSVNQNSTEIDGRDFVDYFRQAMTYDLFLSLEGGSISFQDQLFLPAVLKNITLSQFPHVLIDEAQDLGTLEHAILRKIVSKFPKGRLIAVGDRAQAIYAFRGAHYDSLDKLAEQFDAHWLGLPVSFRCPQAVVKEAQRFDNRIQVWDQSPVGQVERLDSWSLGTLPRPATILCRVNYPLVEAALALIKQGIGAKFLARDFEAQLTDFFQTWAKKSKILPGMFLAIEQEIAKVSEKDSYKADRLADMKECLEAIRDQYDCEDFAALAEGIRTLFNSPGPVTLATIHKAKGLEWPRVYLLRPDLCPHPNAVSEEDIQQEENMLYVAITRAQEYFGYLPKQD